jgi:ferredoxin-NADP reductase/ferredoxin
MPAITFEGRRLAANTGETVLDCLLRHGVALPHSCKSGVCQSCLVRAERGNVSTRAQESLRDTLRAQGYFLACSHRPDEDLHIASSDCRVPARISAIERLSPTVIRVCLRPSAGFDYRPGQFLTLIREDGLARSYSIASQREDAELQLHIRLIPNGAMSGWLSSEAQTGTAVWIQGPSGNCFYVPETADQDLVLAGTGTGLAPLYGILGDALRHGHRGSIWLFHGALTPAGLYLVSDLHGHASRHSNFRYVPSVLNGEVRDGVTVGRMEDCIQATVPALSRCRAYVCGDPGFVNGLRTKLFLAGVASKSIYADSFVPSA